MEIKVRSNSPSQHSHCEIISRAATLDTQSWFHSQEVNILVDSPGIVKEWMAGIDANQNTRQHGQVEYDGIWRDSEGKPLLGEDRGNFSVLKGVGGAIGRVRGTGGF